MSAAPVRPEGGESARNGRGKPRFGPCGGVRARKRTRNLPPANVPAESPLDQTFPRAFVYLISHAALASADAADGTADGVVDLARVGRPVTLARQTRGVGGSWVFVAGPGRSFGTAEGVGDLDGDGFPDIALGVQRSGSFWVRTVGDWRDDRGTVYLVSGADLPILDAVDGPRDGAVNLNVIQQSAPWE